MVRQNWRETGSSCDVDLPISRRIRHPAVRRWRDQGQRAVLRTTKTSRSRVGLAIGFACALAIFFTLIVSTWFQPLPKPQLVLISSNLSNSPLLPPTPFVGNDAQALYGLNSVLNVSDADPDSLSYEEMRAVISRLPDSPLLPAWFPWQKRTTLVYSNAAGLGIPPAPGQEPVPYLLPDDFGMSLSLVGFPTDRAIAVTDLLDKLANQDADHKVLVLDCQRFDHFWPLGVLSNRFVDSVRNELRKNKERYHGIIVIFSCSSGEVTWAENGYYHTAFAYYFIRGLSGLADSTIGNNDGRVSAQELFDYVSSSVQQWMVVNRTDIQVPMMEAVGVDPSEVELLALEPNQEIYGTSEPLMDQCGPVFDDNVRELTSAWEEYYTLARSDPHPAFFRPHLWRSLEDTLLRAERYFRGADMKSMSEELRKVNYRLEAVKGSGKPLAYGEIAYSRPMAELFGDPTPSEQPSHSAPVKAQSKESGAPTGNAPPDTMELAKDSGDPAKVESPPADSETTAGSESGPALVNPSSDDEGKPATKTVTSKPKTESKSEQELMTMACELVEDVINGRRPVDATARTMQQEFPATVTLPVEAEMLRMMAEFGPLAQQGASNDEATSTALQLVQQRVLAEKAAAPASYMAPRVFPWVRSSVAQGDQLRRVQEDVFFARGARKVSVQTAVPEVGDPASGRYQQALQSANRLAHAFQLRDLTLADSVHLVILCGMRKSINDINGFRKQIDPLTLSLLSNLDQLDRQLRLGSLNQSSGSQADQISEIGALASQIEKTRKQILRLVGHEMRDLSRGQQTQKKRSDDIWRRIDAILTLPFAYSDEPSETLAERRIVLLKRLCEHISPTPDEHVVKLPKETANANEIEMAQSEHIKYSRKLAAAFYSLPDSMDLESLECERDASAYSPAIARGWLKTYESATTISFPQRDLNRLLQSDTACRIMESYPISIGLPSSSDLATQTLHRRDFAALCTWQGSRLAEDFWAGEANAEDFYFHRTGQHYLRIAQGLNNRYGNRDVALEERLDELFGIASSIQQQGADGIIFSKSPRIVFRGVDQEELELAVRLPEETPPGVATLQCKTGDSNVTIRSLPDRKSEFPVTYLVEREPSQSVSTRLMADLYYRGHTCARSMNVRGPSDDDGPTVVVVDQIENEAALIIRPAEINAAPANILFVLDCSRSMLFGDRMETLQSTLQQFKQKVTPGTLNVGVRVFGDSVVWTEGDPAAEAAARKDSRLVMPIRPFSTKRFREVIGDLHAVGESPIIYSLLEAQEDFKNLAEGEKVIVLISDGSDNWAAVGEKPGLEQFETAYGANDITVHTVGFQTDVEGYFQLQQIAASTGGHSVRADNGDDLLDNILSLAGVLTYTVTSQPESSTAKVAYEGIITYDPEPLRLAPGTYDIAVKGHADRIVANRLGVQLRRGGRYELLYGGGELNYLPTADLGDVARAVDQQSGVQLRILQAETQENDLVISYSLANPRLFGWFPNNVSMRVQGRGADTAYVVRDLLPNVAQHHDAVWQIRLANWPPKEYLADITVTWSDVGDPDQTVYPLAWDATLPAGTLPEGVQLTRRDLKTERVNGSLQKVAWVELVFPVGFGDVQDWSVEFEQRSLRSQQTYDVLDAIYSAQFVLPSDAQPQRILIRGPHGKQQSLKTVVDLRAQRIN